MSLPTRLGPRAAVSLFQFLLSRNGIFVAVAQKKIESEKKLKITKPVNLVLEFLKVLSEFGLQICVGQFGQGTECRGVHQRKRQRSATSIREEFEDSRPHFAVEFGFFFLFR